jgi:hypothetical protein
LQIADPLPPMATTNGCRRPPTWEALWAHGDCSNLLHIAQVGEASAKQRIYSIFLAEAPVISGTV